MKVSMIVLASAFVIGATASSFAVSPQTDAQFCRGIGLQPEQRVTCTQDMTDAMSADDKDAVAAKWVAVSPLASKSPTSLFQPPVDNNIKNGDPATHTKDKISVNNEVAAQIHRAMKMNGLEF